MDQKPIGRVVHWYDKISVAVIKLAQTLKSGERIIVRRGGEEFEATVDSLQANHQPVTAGKKGDEVAVKLPQKAREGSEIFPAE